MYRGVMAITPDRFIAPSLFPRLRAGAVAGAARLTSPGRGVRRECSVTVGLRAQRCSEAKTGGPHRDFGKVAGDCGGLAPYDVAAAWVAGDGIPNDIQALAADLGDCELSNKGFGVIPGDEFWGVSLAR